MVNASILGRILVCTGLASDFIWFHDGLKTFLERLGHGLNHQLGHSSAWHLRRSSCVGSLGSDIESTSSLLVLVHAGFCSGIFSLSILNVVGAALHVTISAGGIPSLSLASGAFTDRTEFDSRRVILSDEGE